MITVVLCWCRDDDEVVEAARRFCQQGQNRYIDTGCRQARLETSLGRLKNGGDLVITAHGSPLVLGGKGDTFYDFTVEKFTAAIRQHLPRGKVIRLFFDICNGYEFAQQLASHISAEFPALELFGCEGETDMEIDLSQHRKA